MVAWVHTRVISVVVGRAWAPVSDSLLDLSRGDHFRHGNLQQKKCSVMFTQTGLEPLDETTAYIRWIIPVFVMPFLTEFE